MVMFDLKEHAVLEHPKELSKSLEHNSAYVKALSEFTKRLKKRYPDWNRNFTSIFTEQPMKPRKLWKCPDCGAEMGYHSKYYHEQNKDRYCAHKFRKERPAKAVGK